MKLVANPDDLLCREIATAPNLKWSFAEIHAAHQQLVSSAKMHDAVRHAWITQQLPWFKKWNEECEPVRLYCMHINFDGFITFPLDNRPGVDAILSAALLNICTIEVTMAFRDITGGKDVASSGYQEHLKSEAMVAGQIVSETTLYRRDSGRIVAKQQSKMSSSDRKFSDWQRGIEHALNKKKTQKIENGSNDSKLVVYAYGLSGHPGFKRGARDFSDIVAMVDQSAFENNFDETIVMSYDPGWFFSYLPNSR